MAAGGESAGGNAVTQRGEIFLGRGGRAGFGPGTTFGVSFVAQRSGLASARGDFRERRALGGRGVSRAALMESFAYKVLCSTTKYGRRFTMGTTCAAVLGVLATLRYLVPAIAGLPFMGDYLVQVRKERAA